MPTQLYLISPFAPPEENPDFAYWSRAFPREWDPNFWNDDYSSWISAGGSTYSRPNSRGSSTPSQRLPREWDPNFWNDDSSSWASAGGSTYSRPTSRGSSTPSQRLPPISPSTPSPKLPPVSSSTPSQNLPPLNFPHPTELSKPKRSSCHRNMFRRLLDKCRHRRSRAQAKGQGAWLNTALKR